MVLGHIPDKIAYVVRPEEEVARGWDDLPGALAEPVRANPAYPYDPAGKGEDNAVRWGGKGATFETTANLPIASIKILTLEVRAEGGRAYKVSLPSGYLVDLREDVFLDAMLVQGVKRGGELKGPFVWGKVGSQTKLVRVGSALHKALLASGKLRELKPLGAKEWVPGGVYESRKGEPLLYLGRFDSDWVENIRASWSYSWARREIRDERVWCSLKYAKEYQEQEIWAFKPIHKPALIKKTGEVEIGDVVANAHRRAKLWAQRCKDSKSHEAHYLHWGTFTAHLRKPGEPFVVAKEYEELWKEAAKL